MYQVIFEKVKQELCIKKNKKTEKKNA